MSIDFSKNARQRLMESIMTTTNALTLNEQSVVPLYFVSPPGHDASVIDLHYVNEKFRRQAIKLSSFQRLKNKREYVRVTRVDIATIAGVENGRIVKLKDLSQPTLPELINHIANYLQIEISLNDVDVNRSVNQYSHAEVIISNQSLRYIGKLIVLYV